MREDQTRICPRKNTEKLDKIFTFFVFNIEDCLQILPPASSPTWSSSDSDSSRTRRVTPPRTAGSRTLPMTISTSGLSHCRSRSCGRYCCCRRPRHRRRWGRRAVIGPSWRCGPRGCWRTWPWASGRQGGGRRSHRCTRGGPCAPLSRCPWSNLKDLFEHV